MGVHETAEIENATLGDSEIREYVTVHDSTIGSVRAFTSAFR